MGRLKLTLHPAKTHLVDLGREGFEFLGFHFHKRKVRKMGKLLPYFWPGQKAMKAVGSKIRQIAGYSRKRLPMEKIVSDLNPVVRGWRTYFSVGNSTKQLKALNHYLWLRTRRSFLAHHQGNRGSSKRDCFPSWFARSGVEHFYLPGLCGSAPGRKIIGKPYEGEPHVRFDVAGNGNPDMVELMRHSQMKRRAPARLDLRPIGAIS